MPPDDGYRENSSVLEEITLRSRLLAYFTWTELSQVLESVNSQIVPIAPTDLDSVPPHRFDFLGNNICLHFVFQRLVLLSEDSRLPLTHCTGAGASKLQYFVAGPVTVRPEKKYCLLAITLGDIECNGLQFLLQLLRNENGSSLDFSCCKTLNHIVGVLERHGFGDHRFYDSPGHKLYHFSQVLKSSGEISCDLYRF